ncbi:hypothetical protein [Eikenella sp. Marseille-P7795]|uniref:hypothetical protein n=1 Tax=Eikenella sp. Marseille-P7795 TaxID=2866577 RepID=UPI001CE4689C|nr:hypothetical protein [Eikenella sp. Marseille-P7795]
MFTLNGFGTTFVGECDYEPDGSYITTAWIVALWILLIPLYSARILSADSTLLSGTNYQIIKLPVDWRQARRIWAYVLGIPALLALFVWMTDVLDAVPSPAGQILFWLAAGAMLAYAFLPYFLRYRACKAIGLRYGGLNASPLTWLMLVLLVFAIGYAALSGGNA